MHHLLNSRVKQIEISKIRQISEMAARYDNVISLTIGQPDFYTPEHIKSAGQAAILNNKTSYPPTSGYKELLISAAGFLQQKYGLHYDSNSEILVTNGATEGIYIALRSILDEDSEVILPAPIYSGYEPIIRLCGARPVYVDTSSTDFKITAQALENAISEKTRCIILAYPMNPTGATLSKKEMNEIRNVLIDKEIFVVSDEIYSELNLDNEHVSIAQTEGMKYKTIIVNGLSKSHAMTGWRIGFTFAPSYITEQMKKVHQYAVTAVSSISQMAAIDALTVGRNDASVMREEYRKRRDYVLKRLKSMKFDVIKPEGAFYIFPSISKFKITSHQFAIDLLENAKVAVVPGDAFSEFGEGYIRISYASSMVELKEALDRIENYMNTKYESFYRMYSAKLEL
ncbi:aminotransferase A (plasmid) [Bacillus cereus]|uniref:Aminotransferase n=1 Tax=Bacillus cereus (strain ZK / E33L) TaxID=288681 RepID=Q4V1E1_BACCZ|nr:aminotransferase A [Bacillus cereus]AAY60466.1 aminotransferase [Bacillus cereus E33L]AJI26115.1 putative aminotransferase A [Bacillus cereus E33L]QQA19241.1 aminotransferase A [Bacillus cereus]